MNIFYLDEDPKVCAQLHCDKHVVKMIIEYAQLMSTAHRVLDGEMYVDRTANGRRIKRWRLSNTEDEKLIYKASHINHPSGIWTRTSKENYKWLFELWCQLCLEYTHRYRKRHLTDEKLFHILAKFPKNLPDGPLTKMAQAMPDDVKTEDSIVAYQDYYKKYKRQIARWTDRPIPEFMQCTA